MSDWSHLINLLICFKVNSEKEQNFQFTTSGFGKSKIWQVVIIYNIALRKHPSVN